MSKRIRIFCLTVTATLVLGHSHVAPAWGQYFDGTTPDDGVGAFGGGYRHYPGRVFGYDRAFLATRAISAYGGFGTLSYGTPQAPPPEVPRTTTLLRSAKATTPSLATATTEPSDDRIEKGEAAFRDGDYSGAIADWCKELTVGHFSPVLQLMFGQAHFAVGNYREATVATQAAMHALPTDRWGLVVSNRKELYNNLDAYNVQLQQLEAAVHEKPADPALRFLLGYHYACLGYPLAALIQLDQVVQLEPRDEMAVQFREALLQRVPDRGAPVITPGVTTPERQ